MADDRQITAKARTDFADLLDSLSEEQLAGNTLCKDWTPMDVAGHLVSFVELGLSLIHISEPTRPPLLSRMPSSA